MTDKEIDLSRRRFLTATTAVVGGAGMVAAGVAGVLYMGKSERTLALGAPTVTNISKLQPGEMITVEWRSQPVWILHRTPEMLASLDKLTDQVRDPKSLEDFQPEYARNPYRSVRKEIFVVIGICTHLGCSPKRIKKEDSHEMGSNWEGGYLCACHGSTFDYAGRVYKSVPAQNNLQVPIHRYDATNNEILIIGEDPQKGAA